MIKYKLKSNSVIELNLADIESALRLYRAIIHECKNANLDITIATETTVADLLTKNTEAILNIIGSELVLEELKECGKHVLYKGQKFDMSLFEDVKNREDFLPLMTLIAIENLKPFFADARIIFEVLLSQIVK